jgi:hypothetical protein
MRTRTSMPDKLYIVTDSTDRSPPSDGVPIRRAREIAKGMDATPGSGQITIRGPYVLQSRQAVEINGEPIAPMTRKDAKPLRRHPECVVGGAGRHPLAAVEYGSIDAAGDPKPRSKRRQRKAR